MSKIKRISKKQVNKIKETCSKCLCITSGTFILVLLTASEIDLWWMVALAVSAIILAISYKNLPLGYISEANGKSCPVYCKENKRENEQMLDLLSNEYFFDDSDYELPTYEQSKEEKELLQSIRNNNL